MKKQIFSKLTDRLKAEKNEELSALMMRYAFSYQYLFICDLNLSCIRPSFLDTAYTGGILVPERLCI